MNIKHTFLITVPPVATEEFTKALVAHNKSAPGKKLRRTKFEVHTPGSYQLCVEVTITEPGATTLQRDITVELKVNPVAMLLDATGFTDNVFTETVSVLLEWFRAWTPTVLLGISSESLAHITENDLKLVSVAAQYLFQTASKTDAMRLYMNLLQHCKVVLDTGAPYSVGKRRVKRIAKVQLSTSTRCSFTVELGHLPYNESFGHAEVELLIDDDDSPREFGIGDAPSLQALIEKTTRLLCVNVTVDTAKRLHTGEATDVLLPQDVRQWTHEKLPKDPFETIWAAVRYALWLNLTIPTIAPDTSLEEVSDPSAEVLSLYLNGGDISKSKWIITEADKRRYRKKLICKEHIDILTPWAYLQLNQSAVIADALNYQARVMPSQDLDLAPYSLSRKNVRNKAAALRKAIAELPAPPRISQRPQTSAKRPEQPDWPMPKRGFAAPPRR